MKFENGLYKVSTGLCSVNRTLKHDGNLCQNVTEMGPQRSYKI